MTDLADRLTALLGPGGVLAGDAIGPRYHADWSGMAAHQPDLVVRPASTAEVAAVLALCNESLVPVVAQGGMTGLVGGAVAGAGEIALSLERMARIEALDEGAGTITLQAGVPLAAAQARAEEAGFLLPVDLGARGSCQIGGNIATNAGGNRVLRYGMMRDSVLGLEAVLADGTVIGAMRPMVKDNAGYDLKQLFIGSEGTLGIVTRAILRLRPLPRSRATALCAVPGFAALVALLRAADAGLGGGLSAFEAMWANYWRLVLETVPGVRAPLAGDHPIYALIEMQGAEPARDAALFEALLARAAGDGHVADAVIAKSEAEAAGLWAIRDGIAEASRALSPFFSFDVSLALGDMERFIAASLDGLTARFPGHRTVVFGHVGDGNLHLVTHVGDGAPATAEAVDRIVYGAVGALGGSISAEHGIGRLKRGWLAVSRSEAEIALMRTLKRALDPNGILTPGRVI